MKNGITMCCVSVHSLCDSVENLLNRFMKSKTALKHKRGQGATALSTSQFLDRGCRRPPLLFPLAVR